MSSKENRGRKKKYEGLETEPISLRVPAAHKAYLKPLLEATVERECTPENLKKLRGKKVAAKK